MLIRPAHSIRWPHSARLQLYADRYTQWPLDARTIVIRTILLLCTFCHLSFAQAGQSDTLKTTAKFVSDSFPNWVMTWKKQNHTFEPINFTLKYEVWDENQTSEPRDFKTLSQKERDLIQFSPDGSKYIQICGFCAYAKTKKGEEVMAGDHHGYLTFADLSRGQAQDVLFWSFFAPILEGKWIDNDRFLAIGERPVDPMIQPYYYLIDTRRKTYILFESKVYCAPLEAKD